MSYRSPVMRAAALAALCAGVALAVPPDSSKDPTPAGKSDAEKAAAAVAVAKGLTVELWAAEPLLANPVAFAFDEKGRCFVAETTRFGHGVPDTRSFMYWLDDDLACRTVADRVAMYKKEYPGKKPYAGYEKFDDQVRMVWDAKGAGTATDSSVFAKGFNRPEDGLAAGILARKGSVYLTNIPDLWLLKDTKGTNTADVKQSLSTGYGIHVQFLGHDLHGLRFGPDGRLYFSIGDRGFNIVNKEGKKLFNPDSGAVLRCDPNGANLEVVHVGLRNPQELAFDDFGNLFTYDNNSDSGDQARWVYVVEGGDSGWRCGYQYETLYHPPGVPQGNRGAWNTEKIWHANGPDVPAYVVPALANFGSGPSGLAHYPGVGLNDRYKDHFFACDFTSSAASSKIWSLAVKPKGAAFEVTDRHEFVRQMVPTDCDFGPDGAFYWSDWVSGWNPQGKGRIFKLTDPEAMKNPAVGEAKQLLADGFDKTPIETLAKLLGHPHQQVRQEAHFELAARATRVDSAANALASLVTVAKESKELLPRLHAIWALGIVGRSEIAKATAALVELAADKDPEVRAQVARTLLAQPVPAAPVRAEPFEQPNPAARKLADAVAKLVADPDPRVRALAAPTHGRFAPHVPAVVLFKPASEHEMYDPLFALLKSNADADAYVRQAAVQGLVAATANPDDLFRFWNANKAGFDTPAVRLGVVLALRRLGGGKVAEFLADADPKVAVEAARAAHDERIEAALPKLAELADKSGLPDAIAYRALSANAKLGTPEHAARLANFAARAGEPDHQRVVALKLLAEWAKPSRRDAITGLTQDLGSRAASDAAAAVTPHLAKVFAGSDAVRGQAVKTVTALGIADVGPLMAALVKDTTRPAGIRGEAVLALAALKVKELPAAVAVALESPDARLRAAARLATANADLSAAAAKLPELLADSKLSIPEKQAAFDALARVPESKDADAAIAKWLDDAAAGTIPAELRLDVTDAAKARLAVKNLKLHAPLKDKLAAIDKADREAAKKDPLAPDRAALVGGDADRGRNIVLNSAAVYCQRCHKIDGQGGEVGPALNGVAKDKTREYLLEAVLYPNKAIAKGYESVLLTLADGRTVSGVLRAKDAKSVTVVQADGKVLIVPKDDIETERPDKSAMPDDLAKKLTRRELRDVVEFLANLK